MCVSLDVKIISSIKRNDRHHEVSDTVTLAILAAKQEAAAAKNDDNDPPLFVALKHSVAEQTVFFKLLAAWPGAVKAKTSDGKLALHLALENKVTETVTLALLGMHQEAVKEKGTDGNTTTHLALTKKASEVVVLYLLDVHPEAPREKSTFIAQQYSALTMAVMNHASDAVLRVLIASFPEAMQQVTATTTYSSTSGDTPLHTLSAARWDTPAECRRTNALCLTLVEKGASMKATNAKGQTPQAVAEAGITGLVGVQQFNRHLIATFTELAMYKARKHLQRKHFRNWTTVSHSWCPWSAQLTALAVLMVGCSYKRLATERKLPRLPMDAWYRILNFIPRHELRQGDCNDSAEAKAKAKCVQQFR